MLQGMDNVIGIFGREHVWKDWRGGKVRDLKSKKKRLGRIKSQGND